MLSQSSSRIRPNKVGMQRQEAIVVDCESVLEFDKSTLIQKILFIYKVYDITVLPLLLITMVNFIFRGKSVIFAITPN